MRTSISFAYGPYRHGKRWRVVIACEGKRDTYSYATEAEAKKYIDGVRSNVGELQDVLREFITVPQGNTWVYLLWSGGAIVYVGKSMNVTERVSEHRRNGLEFDEAEQLAEPLAGEDALALESWLIWKLQPKYNKQRVGNDTPAESLPLSKSPSRKGSKAA